MYVDMTFIGALEAYGPGITSEQAGCAFGATTYGLCHANKAGGDMAKTMEIAVRCGQDNDCNPSSACGVLGCSLGLAKMEDKYKSYLPKLAGRNFAHTNYSYDTITDACLDVARQVIKQAGGKIVKEGEETYAIIPEQEPIPPMTLEQWPDESQKRMIGIGK
jgi:hypothetical protein